VNKSQLVERLAGNHFEGNKRAASHALESVVDTVMREVLKGQKVAITGFGAFERQDRPSRMVRNPRTGERKRAKKTAVPKFRAGAEFKSVVSGAKKLPKLTVSPAKKTTAKKTTGPSTSRTSASKATSARSTGTRSAARATTAKKSTAKRSTAKTTTARKSSAKKSS
jgi:DNA-binding protein HU-beta